MFKYINPNLVDVFFNKGWESWVRMYYDGYRWHQQAGDERLAKGAANLLNKHGSKTNA